eukprot:Pgem_evm1s13553
MPDLTNDFEEQLVAYTLQGIDNTSQQLAASTMIELLQQKFPMRFDLPFEYDVNLVISRVLSRHKNNKDVHKKKTGLPGMLRIRFMEIFNEY